MNKKNIKDRVIPLMLSSKTQQVMIESGYKFLNVWVENMNSFFGGDYLKDFGKYVSKTDQEWQKSQLELLDSYIQCYSQKNTRNEISERDFETLISDPVLVSFFKLNVVEMFFSEYFEKKFVNYRIEEIEAMKCDLEKHCLLVNSKEDEIITTNYPQNLQNCQDLYNQISLQIFESYNFFNTKRRGFNVKSGKVIDDIFVTAEVYSKGTISSLEGSIFPKDSATQFRLKFDTRCIHYGSKIPNYQNILYGSTALFAGNLYEKFNSKKTFELATRAALTELCITAELIQNELGA